MIGRSAADNRLPRLCRAVSRISWRTCVAHQCRHRHRHTAPAHETERLWDWRTVDSVRLTAADRALP